MSEPLVSIICITYNQAPFLQQCIEGFVMQKANFPFEVIIHDDASTDNTASIIEEYRSKFPDIIKPIYQKINQYSIKKGRVSKICYNAARGKYIAICEGDDYWIDPLKIQKQVDFLERNSDFGLIYGNQYDLKPSGDLIPYIPPTISTFEDILLRNSIPTATTCFRKSLLNQILLNTSEPSKDWILGDYPLWLWIFQNSKIEFLNDFFAVHRTHKDSATDFNNFAKGEIFFLSVIDIKTFFYAFYRGEKPLRYFTYREYYSLFTLAIKYRKILKCIKYFTFNPVTNIVFVGELIKTRVFN